MVKNKILIKWKNKKRFIASIILTLLFLLTFILGMVPIYPFGAYEFVGDVGNVKFTSLVTIPIYPLILISNFLEKINIPEGKIELFYLIIMGIVIIAYYYLLSRIIIKFILKLIKYSK